MTNIPMNFSIYVREPMCADEYYTLIDPVAVAWYRSLLKRELARADKDLDSESVVFAHTAAFDSDDEEGYEEGKKRFLKARRDFDMARCFLDLANYWGIGAGSHTDEQEENCDD